jgi:hypothetical protein
MLQAGQAHVAELADALDSGFHFRCFQRLSPRFNQSDYTPDFIGGNALQPHQQWVSIQSSILSQKV